MSRKLIEWPPRCIVGRIGPIRLFRSEALTPRGLERLARESRKFSGIPADDEVVDAIRSAPGHFASGKGASFENSLLLLIFNNTTIANIGDATGLRATTTAGSLYLSLHTANPTAAGDQTTSEIGYTSYVRKSISRASGAGGFTVTANSAALTDALTSFVAGTGGSGTATYFGIGSASSSTGILMYFGQVTPSIVTGSGITPQLTSATAATES